MRPFIVSTILAISNQKALVEVDDRVYRVEDGQAVTCKNLRCSEVQVPDRRYRPRGAMFLKGCSSYTLVHLPDGLETESIIKWLAVRKWVREAYPSTICSLFTRRYNYHHDNLSITVWRTKQWQQLWKRRSRKAMLRFV